MKVLYRIILFLCMTLPFGPDLVAQFSIAPDAPRVFIDCQRTRCYREHIRTELSYMNFMQDRQSSDIFLQLTSLRTGTGGRAYTLTATGQGRFEGLSDTMEYSSGPDATDSQLQDLQVEKIQRICVPFLLKTSIGESIEFTIPVTERSADEVVDDPWNYWTFRIGGGGFVNGQESSSFLNLRGNVSASQVTEQRKFRASVNFSYNEEKFKLNDEEFVSTIKDGSFRLSQVFSVNDHWSVGGSLNGFTSSFQNIDFSVRLRPAVEYNLFPYSEATKRQLTFLYEIGPSYTNYGITTIFGKDNHWVGSHELEINYRLIEDWGSIDLELNYGNYLHDWSLLFLSFNPDIEWNLFKGFNLNIGAFISLIRNQINLPQSDVSDEEILLQIKQLKSNYRYFGNVGISYRFGSQFNNVVNTRF